MVAPLTNKYSFSVGTAVSETVCLISMVLDEFAHDHDEAHALIYTLSPALATEIGFLNFWTVDVAARTDPQREILAMGEWGDLESFSADAQQQESVAGVEGTLRGMRRVGDQLYATGMGHQLFREDQPNQWSKFSPPQDLKDAYRGGRMEAIDGFAADDCYIAGDDGVIWHFDGAEFLAIPLATNVSFHDVICASDGRVYAVGQGGLIAVGRGNSFSILKTEGSSADLWGVSQIAGRVFVSSFSAVFEVVDTTVKPARPALEKAGSFYCLTSFGRVMWSIGKKDVLITDGDRWERIELVDVKLRGE